MPYTEASDAELIVYLRSGKQDALTELFKRFWKPLYLNAMRKLQSHEIAEEIVQDIFTELWDKRDRLFTDEKIELAAYLYRAVKNKILNHVRKQVYDKKYWEYCRQHLPTSENSTEEITEYHDLQDKLDDAVNRLSDKTRKIFVLHKLQGIPVAQISQKLKLSEKAVGYHLTKSVKEMREYLHEFVRPQQT